VAERDNKTLHIGVKYHAKRNAAAVHAISYDFRWDWTSKTLSALCRFNLQALLRSTRVCIKYGQTSYTWDITQLSNSY